ncbi:SpoIIE family protein phosphatase [Telluria mixta]|uniref:SpoIIE family protein phosphatase n=1 Tax=Telluria mixta TaxID=34071 RepID=A0ABT2BTP8_9BURK|nr:ATP-binding SpoIIE family protein phosphatase [Telluria mixta]MCS0628483.1 SpoIIE family protein phosphatase [Telluria mixta]WEM93411.1 ATP-binding protein/SpoIIE family protein phosphatase [Telluria mixta]
METLISSLSPQLNFAITHASDVAAARRAGQKLADALGFDDVKAGRLAIIITEAATNILKHAGEGTVTIMRTQSGVAMPGVDVVAVDNGPGIADLDFALRDGVSTAGTAGTGLGALRRQADEFDAWTQHGRGSAFFMRIWRGAVPSEPCGIDVGALCTPLAGEDECGDGWGVTCDPDGATLLGVDGLGHGPEAAKAAAGAIEALEKRPAAAPGEVVQTAHELLRITRGAALSVARIDYRSDEVRFAGIGNVSAIVHDGMARRALVSHNGIVGHNMRKVQEFTVPFPPGALCVLASDGIQTQWDLSAYPGLHVHAPALVAAVLMRDYIRRRDDAMVLVARRRMA